MGTLTDYYDKDNTRNAAAALIHTVNDLTAQETTDKAALTLQKNKVKSDIAGDVYNKSDIILLGELLQRAEAITIQKSKYKAELLTLKTMVSDPTYEAEIQTEADKL